MATQEQSGVVKTDIIGGFPEISPNCNGCGKPLLLENAALTDGCPCNSPLGCNSMNETRWRLLMEFSREVLSANKTLGVLEESKKTLQDWARLIWHWADRKGWNDGIENRTQGDWIALAHSELSEALEEARHPDFNVANKTGMSWVDDKNGNKPEGVAVEYVDCIIRILHWFAVHDSNPDELMKLKMDYNETRPHRHGGKKL